MMKQLAVSKSTKASAGALAVTTLTVTLVSCTGGVPDPEAEVAPFYEGKVIELIVPNAAGGGSDTMARWLAPLLAEYLPGRPRVQVINIEGASGVTGANEFARAEPDGLTWLISGEGGTTSYLVGDPAVEFDYADWAPIVGFPLGNLMYMRADAGIDDATDLPDADTPLVVAAQPGGGGSTMRALTMDMLDANYDLVTGYQGNQDAIAVAQGEIDVTGASTTGYISNVLPDVEAGRMIPLYSFGYQNADGEFVRDPAVPEIPHFAEVYEEIHGTEPSGELWDAFTLLFASTRALSRVLWLPGDAPEEGVC